VLRFNFNKFSLKPSGDIHVVFLQPLSFCVVLIEKDHGACYSSRVLGFLPMPVVD